MAYAGGREMALTAALTELVETVGLAAAIELVRVYSGRGLYVPKEPDARHPIALLIGLSAARKLSELYGGSAYVVPPERSLLVELRHAEIVRRIEGGESVHACALAFGVSRKWVHQVLGRAGVSRHGGGQKVDPRQLDLWDGGAR